MTEQNSLKLLVFLAFSKYAGGASEEIRRKEILYQIQLGSFFDGIKASLGAENKVSYNAQRVHYSRHLNYNDKGRYIHGGLNREKALLSHRDLALD